MSSSIDAVNEGALALRDIFQKYKNMPKDLASPFPSLNLLPIMDSLMFRLEIANHLSCFLITMILLLRIVFWNGSNAYEPMSLKCWQALAKSSSVTFDVGSYSGVYSLVAATRNNKGKVFAFEALDTVYSRLLVNKLANRLGNLEVHHCAISDREGFVEFNVYAGDSVLSTGSSLLSKQTGRSIFQKKQVRSTPLDALMSELNISRLDLIKIDAEGAEHLIFNGAQEALKKHSPDIFCEFLKGAQTEGIESMLVGMGYRFFQINEKLMRIVAVEKIVSSDSMDTLNTLITRKPLEQLHQIIEGK